MDEASGSVDVVLMDGTDKIERVDESMIRAIDQDSHTLPPPATHADEGIYCLGDLVTVALKVEAEDGPEEHPVEARITSIDAAQGLYSLKYADGSGMVLTGISGEALTPVFKQHQQCIVLLGRDGRPGLESVTESGTVTAVLERGEEDDEVETYTVRLASGREVQVGVRRCFSAVGRGL